MNKSSPSSRGQAPYTPRRPSTSGSQRPSTSSGEAIEPTSAILRDALREKKGLQPRARSTTPRRVRTGLRSQSYRDEWLQSSDDDSVSGKRSAQRPPRPRRVSDLGVTKNTPPVTRNLGSREVDSKIDKLEKENWDLKHRIMLYQERAKALSDKLDENEADLERLGLAEERNIELAEEVESLQQRLDETFDESTMLQDNNMELTDINEELVKQLETRVKELEAAEKDTAARQSAIEEAAGIIQNLEQRLTDMEKELKAYKLPSSLTRPADSDYFSGDTTAASLTAGNALPVAKPPQLSHSADSDYFSADTSPLVTPRSLKRGSVPLAAKEAPKLAAAQQSTMSFNRELGLRSITSKDSLLSTYLESPGLPPATSVAARLIPLRSLRKRTLSSKALRTPVSKPAAPEASKEKKTPAQGWSDTRPLRNLYMTGELGVQIDTKGIPVPPGAASESSSRASPYSSSPENDKYGGAKAKSTGSIAGLHGRSNSVATRPTPAQPPAMHGRANSINGRVHATPTRTNTLPGKLAQRPSPRRSSTEKPLPAAPQVSSSLRPSMSSSSRTGSSHPLASHPVVAGSNASPKSNASNASSLSRPPITSRYTTPPSQTAPTFATGEAVQETPSPNYAIWPRRYPAWPPSAGLLNRTGLFQGEGLDEIFGAGDDAEDVSATHF